MRRLRGGPEGGDSRIATIAGAIVLLVFLVTIVGLSLLAIADGGYRPERYAGGLDPFRVGILILLVPGWVLAILFAANALESWRMDPLTASLVSVVGAIGFLLSASSLVALMLWWPAHATQVSLPEPMAITLVAGMGLVFIGLLPDMTSGLRDVRRHGVRIARGDRILLAGLVVLAAWILIGLLRRL